MLEARKVFHDGALVPLAEARVSALAHSLQRGSLVFDVLCFRATPRGPALFRLHDHLRRFLRSASIVDMRVPFDLDALSRATREVVRESGLAEGLVRVLGCFPSIEGDLVPLDARGLVTIAAYAPNELPRLHVAPGALRVQIPTDVRKAGPDVFPPDAKVAAAYLGPMLARRRALAAGYDEIVLLDRDGFVAEAPTSNVFAVIGGALVTPPLGMILDGITRASVLALAADAGLGAREAPLSPDALRSADEVFLTVTSSGVAPVATIDGVAIGDGAPGPITRALKERLHAAEIGDDPRSPAWVTWA